MSDQPLEMQSIGFQLSLVPCQFEYTTADGMSTVSLRKYYQLIHECVWTLQLSTRYTQLAALLACMRNGPATKIQTRSKNDRKPRKPSPDSSLKTNAFFDTHPSFQNSFAHPKASESLMLRRGLSFQTHLDMGQDFILLDTRYHDVAVLACGVLAFVAASAGTKRVPIATSRYIADVYWPIVGVR
jgi:hypothetical protein